MIGGDLRERWRATVRRVAWGRRVEIGLTLVAWVARIWLSQILGHVMTFVVLAVGAGAVVSMPRSKEWLLDQIRAETIERSFSRAVAHIGIRSFDGGIDVAESRVVPGGVSLSVILPEGTSVDALAKGSEKLAVALRARDVRVHRDESVACRADVTVLYDDLLASEVRWPWADAWQTLLWQGLPFGIDEHGGSVHLDLVGHNLLIGGKSGAGKANALALIVGAAALDPHVQLWLFDDERTELAPWQYSARRYVESDVREATEALDELRSLVTDRHQMLEIQKLHKVTPEMEVDLVIVVIHELDLYVQDETVTEKTFFQSLLDLAIRGRTVGVMVVAATENQTSNPLPPVLSGAFEYRLALRCVTREASDSVLNLGWPPTASSASDVDPATPGVGLLLTDDAAPMRMRCYRLDDDGINGVARRAAQLRRQS